MSLAIVLPCLKIVSSKRRHPRQRAKRSPEKKQNPVNSGGAGVGYGSGTKELSWKCVKDCGACCKLDKGPSFPSPEEIFEQAADVEFYKSLIGLDGWCIHYEKSTRTCSIYSDRPYFCRVEPDVFKNLYGIEVKKFNKEACSCCRDTIKSVYGTNSKELSNFNRSLSKSDAT